MESRWAFERRLLKRNPSPARFWFILAAALLVAVACGDGDEAEPPADTAAPATEPAVTEATEPDEDTEDTEQDTEDTADTEPETEDTAAPEELTPVSLRLDWLFQGPNSGFMVAAEQGFYEEAGLDVEINSGEGSATTAQLVGNQSADFGFSDGYVVAQNRSQGVPITMVASIYRRNPNGVLSLAETGIASPTDLVGRSIGIPPGASQAQQWPAFTEGCDVEASEVQVVSVDAAGAVPALLENRVDAIAGYVQGFAPGAEISGGAEVDVLWYADCGVTATSNGIIVHDDMLEERPELIAPFVEASIRGFLYARENPEQAVDSVVAYAPEVNPEVTMRELELSWETWVTPGTAGEPLGWMSPEEWTETLEVLTTYGGVEDPPDPEAVYTNEFVPQGSEYVPPQ